MKTLILTTILLVLPWTVSAEQFYTADDTLDLCTSMLDSTYYGGIQITGSGSGHGIYTTGISHGIWNEAPKKHDTLKEYVTEINEVCDTLWSKHWVPLEELIDGEQYFRQLPKIDSVVCRPDSVWADKVQVWLTPEQTEWLLKFINNPAETILNIELID